MVRASGFEPLAFSVSGKRSNRAELSAQNCAMNWTMMADTNVKHQCYQHPEPPCQGGPSPIRAHSAPVSDSFGVAASGRILAEMADDGRYKERPILLSGAMVRAVLEGRKTQTRRVVKPQPTIKSLARGFPIIEGRADFCISDCRSTGMQTFRTCPYGKPGDLLWVRENLKRPDGDPWLYAADDQPVMVDAQDETAMVVWAHHKQQDYCPSIHMPRWASRITLEITDVRVQRLRDISEEDAKAEGCVFHTVVGDTNGWYPEGYRINFQGLWNSMNAKRGYGWDTNPWVWCISFRRAERAA